ncbi:glycosyltransferase [Desulfovibrio sp. MES5]|uniref:glycosyltransferase n=1 Tax=Desulfovibrio sp. MES5 TaxID=1899016 RepID=UPI0025C2576D|nr:glycosyltransferase [Desulfovibrio sp. MES5]
MVKKIFKKVLPPTIRSYLRSFLRHLERTFIKDYFHTGRDKKVLISYIVAPFITSGLNSHTNFQECFGIAKIFDEMGYSIDIIDYNSSYVPDYSKYSCVFGFGDPFCASFYHHVPGMVRIHYATGAHVHVQNPETLKRAIDTYKKKGQWLLSSCRIVKPTWSEQTTLSNAMIVLGNDWTRNTYAPYFDGHIYNLPTSYNAALPQSILDVKDFDRVRKHYLWFGSAGAIHKGLDLVLDVFSQHTDKTLHVAGLNNSEKEFMNSFHKELSLPNIIMHGFVDVSSPQYADLINNCAFVIMPSCAEAGCTSLVNSMCNGLIPVFTRQCGVDIKNYTLEIQDLSSSAVEDAVARCDALDIATLRQMSNACRQDIRATCSFEAFQNNINTILQKILS